MHAGVQPELVVQLAGTRDTVIDPTDHIDLLSGANFRYLSVEGTSHHAMVRFDGTEAGRERKRKVPAGFAGRARGAEERDQSQRGAPRHPAVQQVVLLLHGIRDHGGWTEELLKEIEAGGAQRTQKVKGRIGNYDYLPLLPFLVGLGRRRHLLQFMDLYAEARAAFPKAKCSFVGHSNGTNPMATALSRYVSCRFDRVAFIGCILHRRFGWIDHMSGRVAAVRNYVATDDWVVAIFPSFFESVRILPFNRDFGSAGHTGFTQVSDRFENVRFIEGGHGAGLETKNRPALLSFLLGDEPEAAPATVPAQGGRSVTAHKMCTYIWILLLVGVVALFYGAARLNGYMGYPWPVVQALYVVVLIFVCFPLLRRTRFRVSKFTAFLVFASVLGAQQAPDPPPAGERRLKTRTEVPNPAAAGPVRTEIVVDRAGRHQAAHPVAAACFYQERAARRSDLCANGVSGRHRRQSGDSRGNLGTGRCRYRQARGAN